MHGFSVAFSRMASIAPKCGVKLWDAATGNQSPATGLGICPDGKRSLLLMTLTLGCGW
ncbi:MAG: hypothetical protein ACR9NN_00925 [Nostochopsis sp.]